MSAARTCLLCGHEGDDVAMGIAWYREPVSREIEVVAFEGKHVRTTERRRVAAHVDQVVRCRDAQACRERLEAAGGEWELDDTTHPSPVPASAPVAVPAAAAGMSDEEVDAWLA